MDHISWQMDKKITEYEAVKDAAARFMQVMMEKDNICIYYDKRTEELMYSCGAEQLPIRLLSSGFRTLSGMVLDIAYRMAILNPDLLENIVLSTPGIVLIDEIDMHLHPNWQWKIVKALQTTFPMVQFIDMPSEVSQERTVKGWQVNDVLEQYMNSCYRDPDTLGGLKCLTALAKKKLKHTISEQELHEYHSIIKELSELLPQGDTDVEEAALLSVEEMLGESI